MDCGNNSQQVLDRVLPECYDSMQIKKKGVSFMLNKMVKNGKYQGSFAPFVPELG